MPRFIEDVSAFAEGLGPNRPHDVLYLATAPWPDGETRDSFIAGMLDKEL